METITVEIDNLVITIPSFDRASWTENLKSEPANTMEPVSDGWPPPCGWNTVDSSISAVRPSCAWDSIDRYTQREKESALDSENKTAKSSING